MPPVEDAPPVEVPDVPPLAFPVVPPLGLPLPPEPADGLPPELHAAIKKVKQIPATDRRVCPMMVSFLGLMEPEVFAAKSGGGPVRDGPDSNRR